MSDQIDELNGRIASLQDQLAHANCQITELQDRLAEAECLALDRDEQRKSLAASLQTSDVVIMKKNVEISMLKGKLQDVRTIVDRY